MVNVAQLNFEPKPIVGDRLRSSHSLKEAVEDGAGEDQPGEEGEGAEGEGSGQRGRGGEVGKETGDVGCAGTTSNEDQDRRPRGVDLCYCLGPRPSPLCPTVDS